MADSDRFLSLSAFGLAVLDILVNCLYCAFVFARVKHNIRFIGVIIIKYLISNIL